MVKKNEQLTYFCKKSWQILSKQTGMYWLRNDSLTQLVEQFYPEKCVCVWCKTVTPTGWLLWNPTHFHLSQFLRMSIISSNVCSFAGSTFNRSRLSKPPEHIRLKPNPVIPKPARASYSGQNARPTKSMHQLKRTFRRLWSWWRFHHLMSQPFGSPKWS